MSNLGGGGGGGVSEDRFSREEDQIMCSLGYLQHYHTYPIILFSSISAAVATLENIS